MTKDFEINTKALQVELQEQNGVEKVKVTLDRKILYPTRIDFRDNAVFIKLNPTKIHSPNRLEKEMNYLREALV